MPERAKGGRVPAGKPLPWQEPGYICEYVVFGKAARRVIRGERGPEIVTLPNDAVVLTATDTRNLLSQRNDGGSRGD